MKVENGFEKLQTVKFQIHTNKTSIFVSNDLPRFWTVRMRPWCKKSILYMQTLWFETRDASVLSAVFGLPGLPWFWCKARNKRLFGWFVRYEYNGPQMTTDGKHLVASYGANWFWQMSWISIKNMPWYLGNSGSMRQSKIVSFSPLNNLEESAIFRLRI